MEDFFFPSLLSVLSAFPLKIPFKKLGRKWSYNKHILVTNFEVLYIDHTDFPWTFWITLICIFLICISKNLFFLNLFLMNFLRCLVFAECSQVPDTETALCKYQLNFTRKNRISKYEDKACCHVNFTWEPICHTQPFTARVRLNTVSYLPETNQLPNNKGKNDSPLK